MPWKRGNRLPLLAEDQAHGRTLEIFRDIKQALGVPHVSTAFRAYAAFPVFFELHWQAVRPVVGTQEFFDLAQRLRADAYTRVFSYFQIPDLGAGADETQHELTSAIELFHYADAVSLLLVAAQFQSFEAPVGRRGEMAARPATHPVFTDAPPALDERAALPATRRIMDELKRASGLPALPYEERLLARWPQFLAAYWDALKAVLASPIYEGGQHAMRETAFALTREFPQPVDLSLVHLTEAGIPDDDLTSIARITEALLDILSTCLLHLSLAKIGLEGGTIPQAARETGTAPERAA